MSSKVPGGAGAVVGFVGAVAWSNVTISVGLLADSRVCSHRLSLPAPTTASETFAPAAPPIVAAVSGTSYQVFGRVGPGNDPTWAPRAGRLPYTVVGSAQESFAVSTRCVEAEPAELRVAVRIRSTAELTTIPAGRVGTANRR